MEIEKIRCYLAFAIVSVFLFTIILLFFSGFTGYMDVETTKDFVKTFSSIFSGLIGVIIGYYFTKN